VFRRVAHLRARSHLKRSLSKSMLLALPLILHHIGCWRERDQCGFRSRCRGSADFRRSQCENAASSCSRVMVKLRNAGEVEGSSLCVTFRTYGDE
jgi:hypothetical protein